MSQTTPLEHDAHVQLFPLIRAVLHWYYQLFAAISLRIPRYFFAPVVLTVLAQLFWVMTFFLPLKILILAGSEGVPSYFRSFMHPESVNHWILIFTFVAIACYIGSIISPIRANRLISVGARSLAELTAGRPELTPHREKELRISDYRQFCNACADLIIIILVISILFLSMPVIGMLFIMILLFEVFTINYILKFDTYLFRRIARKITEETRIAMSFFTGFNFLALFLLILMMILVSDTANFILSILMLLLGRRMLQSIQTFTTRAVTMYGRRNVIGRLLMPTEMRNGGS